MKDDLRSWDGNHRFLFFRVIYTALYRNIYNHKGDFSMFELALVLTVLVCGGMMYLVEEIENCKAETAEIVKW